jgi:hypothetical protein
MAGVPLPTCSGVRAIYDPLKGTQFSFSIPSPIDKNGKLNYINYKFNTNQIKATKTPFHHQVLLKQL